MTPSDWTDALRALLPGDYTPEPEAPASDKPRPKPRLVVTLDRKRAGKTATIISGFDPDDSRAAEMCAELKRSLACGGSVRDGEILIQGDKVSRVAEILKARGYKTNK